MGKSTRLVAILKIGSILSTAMKWKIELDVGVKHAGLEELRVTSELGSVGQGEPWKM